MNGNERLRRVKGGKATSEEGWTGSRYSPIITTPSDELVGAGAGAAGEGGGAMGDSARTLRTGRREATMREEVDDFMSCIVLKCRGEIKRVERNFKNTNDFELCAAARFSMSVNQLVALVASESRTYCVIH